MASVERLQAPTGGIDLEAGPLAVARDRAVELTNLLVGRDGKIRTRGTLSSPEPIYNPANAISGIWVHGTDAMFADVGTSKHVSVGGTVTDVATASSNSVLIGKSVRLGSYAYGPSDLYLLRSDGTAVAPTQITNGPRNVQATAVHLRRLFAGGGQPPGGGTVNLAMLYWSDLDGPTADTLAKWQDDTSGLTNQAEIGSPGDAIVGLASVGRSLLVLKQDSIWTVLGDTPSTWQVRQIASTMGCYDKRSILVADDKLFFAAEDGPVVFDGQSFTRLGLEATSWATNQAIVTTARLDKDYMMFARREVSTSVLNENWLLHLPTLAWSKFEADTGVLNDGLFSWLYQIEDGRAYGFDNSQRFALTGVPRAGDSQTGLESKDGGSDAAVPVSVTYRPVQLALPFSKAVVRRIMVDHQLIYSPVAGGTGAWTVTLRDGVGTLLKTFTIDGTSSASAPGATELRQRVAETCNMEAADLVVTVEYTATGSPPTLWRAELHDIWVEYEPAQKQSRL